MVGNVEHRIVDGDESQVLARMLFAILYATESRGVDVSGIIRDLDLDIEALQEEDARSSVDQEQALWRLCMERLRAPLRGMDVLQAVPRGFLGLPEMLFSTAATFGDALRVAVDFMPLIRTGLSVNMVENGELVEFSYHFREDVADLELASIEVFLSAILTLGVACTGRAPVIRELALPPNLLSSEGGSEEFVRAYGVSNIICDTWMPRVVIPRAALEIRQRSSSPRLHGVLRAHAADVVMVQGRKASFLLRTRHMMLLELERGALDLQGVARRLSMSDRSLQRRLSECGISFAELRDELRRDLALQYLRDGAMPIAEVSYRLGFGSSQAFHRAFHGWFGCAPGRWRLAYARA